MSTLAPATSADQLLAMPKDGFRYELVEGELRRMTPAGSTHGRVAINLTWRLAQHVAERSLGTVFAAETGFLISRDPDTVRAPDVAFVSRERMAEAGETEGYFPGAPDLAVEVVSPSDSYVAVEEKVQAWLSAGSKGVVVVSPRQRSVAVHRGRESQLFGEDDTLDLSFVVPGFRIDVRVLFE